VKALLWVKKDFYILQTILLPIITMENCKIDKAREGDLWEGSAIFLEKTRRKHLRRLVGWPEAKPEAI